MTVTPDEVWHQLVALVMDSRSDWKRLVIEATGLPFTRVRALRRLAAGPLGLRQLAEAMTVDAPAATVAVNDLEERGLVRRTPHPTNRRCKLVELTAEGHRMIEVIRAVPDVAPPALAGLSPDELAQLAGLLRRLDAPAR